MNRFLIRPEAMSGERVIFDARETHHLARVLRLRAGDVVQAADGRGQEFTVRLTRVGRGSAEGEILGRAARGADSPLSLTLVQGLPKGDTLDGIIRMATELGVARIVPVITERTVVRAEAARWGARLARWQRIAREATKQSGRAVVPDVAPPVPLAAWLAGEPERGLFVCFWEGSTRSLAALPPGPTARATVLVGPEGGLTAAEAAAVERAGALVVGLGPRILRAETAGPVALALIQSRYGDLGGARCG